MGALLLESAGGGVSAGFGRKAGLGFSWGNGSPIHTWELLPGGFLDVGHAFMTFGGFIQDWPGPYLPGYSLITAGVTNAALDYINTDESDFAVGPTDEGYSQWGPITVQNTGSDCIVDGSAPNPIPLLLGGNAVKTAVGFWKPGETDGATPQSTYDPATGLNVVTGVGFQPDLVVFLLATAANFGQDGMRVMVGMMDAAGNQWCCTEMGIFGSAGFGIGGAPPGYPARFSEFRSDACFLSLPAPSSFSAAQGRNRASFVSMDADGFTCHLDEWQVGGGAAYGGFLAYKLDDPSKGFFQVGTHVQGDTDLGPYPLDPEAVILVGDSWSPTLDVPTTPLWTGAPVSDRAIFSAGGFDAATNRSTVGGCGSHEGTNPGQYYDDSAIVFGDTSAQTIKARAVGALGTLAASLVWTDDDGGARPFGSLAFRVPFRGGDPALRNAYYLHAAPDVPGTPPDVDESEPNDAEGISLALNHPTLTLDQPWTRIDTVF